MRILGRERLMLAIGVLACTAIFAFGRGVPRLVHWYEQEGEKAALFADRARRARVAVAGASDLAASLADHQRALDEVRRMLFIGTTLNAARANLAAHVGGLARKARVELGPIQITGDSLDDSGVRRIGVSITGTADVHGLMQLLSSLEGGTKVLRITELSVSQTNAAAGPDIPEELRLRMWVQALAIPENSQ